MKLKVIYCELCGQDYKSCPFGRHLKYTHNTTNKKYYDTYLKKSNEGICKVCGKQTKYKSITKGYLIYCSVECKCNDPEYIKKQSDNTKNIKTKKKKLETIINTYGSEEDYHNFLSKMHTDWIEEQGESYKKLKGNN